MLKDRLIIRPYDNSRSCLRKPVMVSNEMYEKIEELSKETRHVKGVLADKMLAFAFDHLEVVTESDDE